MKLAHKLLQASQATPDEMSTHLRVAASAMGCVNLNIMAALVHVERLSRLRRDNHELDSELLGIETSLRSAIQDVTFNEFEFSNVGSHDLVLGFLETVDKSAAEADRHLATPTTAQA